MTRIITRDIHNLCLNCNFALPYWQSLSLLRKFFGGDEQKGQAWKWELHSHIGWAWQIMEACLVSLITSVLSFGLPLMTKCTPCPNPEKYPDVVCPRPSGQYGNYVNVS